MGGQCLLVLIVFKVLVMINLLQNIVILSAQGLLMLMVSTFLIQAAKYCSFYLTVLRPG